MHKFKVVTVIITIMCLVMLFFYTIATPKYSRVPIPVQLKAAPPAFDTQVSHMSNMYSNSDLLTASKLMYDETGVQFYFLDLEVECTSLGIYDDKAASEYCVEYIRENLNAPNAIVFYSFYPLEDDLFSPDGKEVYVSLYDQIYIGDDASKALQGNAWDIFNRCLKENYYSYSGDIYTNTVKSFINQTKYSDILWQRKFMTQVVLTSIPVVLWLIIFLVTVRDRKHRRTVEILSAPLDRLTSDTLVDKYTEES